MMSLRSGGANSPLERLDSSGVEIKDKLEVYRPTDLGLLPVHYGLIEV